MSTRAHISAKTDVSIALMQATMQGRPVLCSLCHEPLYWNQRRVREHLTPRAIRIALKQDPDALEILAWVHKACADLKTRGCEGTSKKGSVANGDTHKIAKAARIADGGKVSRKPMAAVPEHIKVQRRQYQRDLRAKIKAERRV